MSGLRIAEPGRFTPGYLAQAVFDAEIHTDPRTGWVIHWNDLDSCCCAGRICIAWWAIGAMVHAGVVSLAPDNPYEVAKVERPEEFTAAQFALQWFAASDLQLVNQPVAMRALAWDEQPEGVRQEQIDRMQIVLDRMVADGVLAIV